MTHQKPRPKTETRQAEPEIIPPGSDRAVGYPLWMSAGPYRTMHIRMTRPGPVGIAMLMLLIGILGLAGLVLLLGLAFVGLAAAGVLAFGSIVSGLLRGNSDRNWH